MRRRRCDRVDVSDARLMTQDGLSVRPTYGDELCVPLVDVGRSPSVLVRVLLARPGKGVGSVVLAVLENLEVGRRDSSVRHKVSFPSLAHVETGRL